MSILQPQRGAIPVPRASALSRPYWDGLARQELLFQRCQACAGATHTPALVCAHCGSRVLSWEVSSGRGTVYSYTVVARPQTPEFVVPYVPIIVDMEEGWQILSAPFRIDRVHARGRVRRPSSGGRVPRDRRRYVAAVPPAEAAR